MRRLSAWGTGLATAAVGLSVACGGGAATPPSEISAEDLALMVLQQEDVPATLSLLEEDGETRGFVEPLFDPRATAMFIREFELQPDEAEAGTVVCVRSLAFLYESAEDAKRTYRELEELETVFEESSRGIGQEREYEEVSLPELGDERRGYRAFDQSSTFCSSYDDQVAEAHAIVFLRRNVAAGLFVFTYERGASLDEAIELAQKQASRIEAVFEGDDSP